MELEFERKALVDEETFSRLLAYFETFADGERYTQVNTYYDTEDGLLAKTHRTLRVREKKGRLFQQYKYRQSARGDLRTATEYHLEVAALPEKIEGRSLPDGEDATFFPLGSLKTVRTDFKIGGALVSLDQNTYLGYTDYEIEVETEGDTPLPDAVLMLGVDFSAPVIGKFHRFLMRSRSERKE